MVAEIEKDSCGKVFSKCLVIDVLPAPEGAVIIRILFSVGIRKEKKFGGEIEK